MKKKNAVVVSVRRDRTFLQRDWKGLNYAFFCSLVSFVRSLFWAHACPVCLAEEERNVALPPPPIWDGFYRSARVRLSTYEQFLSYWVVHETCCQPIPVRHRKVGTAGSSSARVKRGRR